jgi:SAM-dependent methyltransferase
VVETGSTLSARREGRSKMKVVRTALAHLRFLLRVAGRAGDLAVRPRPPGRGRGGPVPVREVPDDPLAWNRTLNRAHPMRGIERHPNPLVRAVEERRRRTVIRLAALPPGRWVVDVGAEEGAYVPRIAAAGARPLTVDLDPEVLGRGRARHGAPAVAADAARLPFRDGAVPRVILAEVLEHCPDPAAALSEALRIVPAAGRVALSVPDDGPIVAAKRALLRLGLGRLFAGLPPDLAPGHIYIFTRASLRSLLESAGRLRSLTRDPFALAFFAVVAPRREDG